MLPVLMKPRGAFKLRNRDQREFGTGVVEAYADPFTRADRRVQRILDSLRSEILEGGGGRNLRIRQVFQAPREIFRLELELPELGYQRTTLLDRDALEELLEADDVRAVVGASTLGP
jgi:hypothetical protein